MSNKRIQRPSFATPYVALSRLAEQLYLPIKMLLYLSSEGHIPIIVRIFQCDAMYVSVHKDFIAPHGADLPPSVTQLAYGPRLGIGHLGGDNLLGFCLSQDDCLELMDKGQLEQSLFPSAVEKGSHKLYAVFPCPSFLPFDRIPGIDPDGWRAACYPKETVFDLDTGNGYPSPRVFNITTDLAAAQALSVGREDIEAFLNFIDSPAFVGDLIVENEIVIDVNDGKETSKEKKEGKTKATTKIMDVAEERPAYISKKLAHLIDTSQRCWRKKPSNSDEYERKRSIQHKALQDKEFHGYFKKGLVTEKLLEAVTRFIEPLDARAYGDRDGHEYLTPELLILMAAAKLYWSPPHVDLAKVATHPKRNDIDAYLRIRGINEKNDADYAITLIRPEEAALGSPGPEPSAPRRSWAYHFKR